MVGWILRSLDADAGTASHSLDVIKDLIDLGEQPIQVVFKVAVDKSKHFRTALLQKQRSRVILMDRIGAFSLKRIDGALGRAHPIVRAIIVDTPAVLVDFE